MSFLYPLGMIALVAIPVLIVIYIIINKYTEQVISATYLWTLSEKFLKRKNPLRMITGLLSLILQILIVVLIAFSVAQPFFILRGAAADYLFVLDGSGSMNITRTDGSTRLDAGKSKVAEIVKSSADGSTYTLIYAADTTTVLCDSLADKSRVYKLLDGIEGGYCASDFTSALSAAQEQFTANPSLKVYLITDKDFEGAGDNFERINLSSGEENYAVSDVTYEISDGSLVVTGNAWSYASAAQLTLSLYIDGAAEAEVSQTVAVEKLQAAPFMLTSDSVNFSSFTVAIAQTDGLALDNLCTVYSLKSDSSYNTLLVYDDELSVNNAFFLKSALSSFGNVQITVMPSSQYNSSRNGYGLYVFDGYVPSQLPSDGAVWFVNPQGSLVNTGFTVQNNVTLNFHAQMQYSTSSASRVQALLSGTDSSKSTYFIKYVKCGLSRSFYTLLSYGDDPLVFAGTNSLGNRQVTFAFDFHETDFALSENYIPLMYNLFTYTFPEIVEQTSFYCGDTMEVNVLANCTSIRVDSPDGGKITYLDTSSDVAEYVLTEAGTYTVTLNIGDSARQIKIYASLPPEERYTNVKVSADGALYVADGDDEVAVLGADGKAATEVSFVLTGERQNGSRDGTFSELWIWFAALAVLFIIDWGVYCYEQYQLR